MCPEYDYECLACEHEFSAFHRMSDPNLRKCPKCKKAKLQKKICAPALHLEEDFSHLNGGKGMFSPQLAQNIHDKSPDAHFLSTKDLIRKGKKRGLAPVELSTWNDVDD